jgi:hypothetical protein
MTNQILFHGTRNNFKLVLLLIFALSYLGHGYAQPSVITTYAGNGGYGWTGDGVPATEAAISLPVAVATDLLGNVYVSDYTNSVIRKVNSAGIITTIAGCGINGYSGDGGPATNAKLHGPRGIAVDKAGNVYFADDQNHAIRRISTAGIITTVAGIGVAGFGGDGGPATAAILDQPTDVAFDDNGNLFIADYNNGSIRKINPAGIISTIAGRIGATVDSVDDTYIGRVSGIAVDHSGNVFTANPDFEMVCKVDTTGRIIRLAGGVCLPFLGLNNVVAKATAIGKAVDIALDDSGNIYYSQLGYGGSGSFINKINTEGKLFVAAGGGFDGFSGDGGDPLLARLQGPVSIAFDTEGSLFIADAYNHRVRKIGKPSTAIINPELTNSISIHPNPCKGILTVATDGLAAGEKLHFVVLNALGQLVYQYSDIHVKGTATELLLPGHLTNGMYFLRVTSAGNTSSHPFVIER